MRLHRAPTVTALLLAATLTLAACSDDEPREPEPSPTSTGTTAAPTPSPSAEPTEPVLPEAAKKPTEAGARAFITYYWDLINYAQLTGDVKTLKKASGPSCNGCRGGVQAISRVYRGGGRATGGQYAVEIARLERADFDDPGVHAFEGRVKVRNDQQTITSGSGDVQTLSPTTNVIDLYTLWVDKTWRMDVLVVQ